MRQIKIQESITRRDTRSLNQLLQEVSKHEVPTVEEEVELAQRIHRGDRDALNELVTRNMRFVISVAKQYQSSDIPLTDLIQEGSIGLLTAAQRFDETLGFKFCSYAVWWIRQSISKAIGENASMLKVPSNKRAMMSRVFNQKNRFVLEHGCEPSMEELAVISDIDIEKLKSIENISTFVVSADTTIGDDDSTTIMDRLYDPTYTADHITEQDSLRTDIAMALTRLDERARCVLMLSFGLDGSQPMSLDEVSQHLGITRERVRQIRQKGLAMLRADKSAMSLLRKYES